MTHPLNPCAKSAAPSPGFGLGLRTVHYDDFLRTRQNVDWLEVITDNFLVAGGKPLVMLDTLRRDYPMALHGVAMSLGSAQGLSTDYLQQVRQLADRIDALWVSDHLCWTGPTGQPLHDLYPLPYTEECARVLVAHIGQAQDILGRRLVLENVSSYLRYKASAATEWEFLAHIAHEADCELLVDINNIYVSSVNHGFNPMTYLRALPAHRVRQIHLAGHSMNGDFIIDTHDHPVCEAVWQLYAQACTLFGPTATMIERDDHIPPLPELLQELQRARDTAASVFAESVSFSATGTDAASTLLSSDGQLPQLPRLQATQSLVDQLVLTPKTWPTFTPLPEALDAPGPLPGHRGLEIYHNAYRARLAEVLVDHFPKTLMYVGSEHFDELARDYVQQHRPQGQHLGRYGDQFAAHLSKLYPEDTVLQELAELEWALRTRFDAADQAAWTLADVQAQGPDACFHQWPILHPTVQFLAQRSNAIVIWNAIANDEDVPPVAYQTSHQHTMVWRWGLQPHFCSLDDAQAQFLRSLQETDQTIAKVAERQCSPDPDQTHTLGQWLQTWWAQERLMKPNTCHPRACGDPCMPKPWIPAFAGMTGKGAE